ncbi:MAG: DTW domain-containing protein [Deltaproteobacteria bacterium]|nr:MAG: DTW domain-containing protein [Deltaproteobacteria bacterium]
MDLNLLRMKRRDMEAHDEQPQGREECLTCNKPQDHCICDTIVPVTHRTHITIIQHPRERRHPFGTVRILEQALDKLSVHPFFPKGSWADEQAQAILQALEVQHGSENIAVLYPSKEARLLEDLTASERPEHLIILDGTWFQAKKLYEDLPCLHDLPKVAFSPENPSEYQIRREPKEHFVSTLEAVVNALQLLEPDNPQVERLMEPFRAMVARQLVVRENHPYKRRIRRPRQRQKLWMPEPLRHPDDSQVVCHVEYINTPEHPSQSTEIVGLVAYKPATEESFARYLHPTHDTISDWQFERFGIPEDSFQPSKEREQVQKEWSAFLGQQATLIVWHSNNLQLLQDFEQPPQSQRSYALLKEVYANARRTSPGHLEDALTREGLEPHPVPLLGRSGLRLGQSVTMLLFLQQLHDMQTREWYKKHQAK